MSFPPNSDAPQRPVSPQQTPLKPRRHIRPLTWLLLLAIIGPCTVTQIPLEIGRWHLAAAINHRDKDQKDAAYRELAAAMDRFPKSPELLLQRAEWRLDDGQEEEALADCDRMLEVSGGEYKWLAAHSLFLQNAGHFARAVDDWKKIEEFSERSGIPSRATALNGLAYAQALAKAGLDDALKYVDQALEFEPDSAAMLDTRGYIYYLQGDYDSAITDLNTATKGMDEQLEIVRKAMGKDSGHSASSKERSTTRPRTLAELERAPDIATEYSRVARAAATGHFHRAQALAALDQKEEADKELAVARQLIGREPDETLF